MCRFRSLCALDLLGFSDRLLGKSFSLAISNTAWKCFAHVPVDGLGFRSGSALESNGRKSRILPCEGFGVAATAAPVPQYQQPQQRQPQQPTSPLYLTCKVCDRGTLAQKKIFRMSTPVVVIGFILLIPSALGILFNLFWLLAFVFVPTGNVDENAVLGVREVGSGLAIFFAILCFVGGLWSGWLLVMREARPSMLLVWCRGQRVLTNSSRRVGILPECGHRWSRCEQISNRTRSSPLLCRVG